MTRPLNRDDPKWGGEGSMQEPFDTAAPAWSGDLSALTEYELSIRVSSLARHIGNIHVAKTSFEGGGESLPGQFCRPATADELEQSELNRWVVALTAAVNELAFTREYDRRAQAELAAAGEVPC